MKQNEVVTPATKNMVNLRGLWIFGIILVLATASVGCSGRSFYTNDGDVFEGRGTHVDWKPGDNFLVELAEALEIEFSKTNRLLHQFLENGLESDLFSGDVFEGRGTRVDWEPGGNFLVEIGKADVLEVSKTIHGLVQGF